jgi:hypothetical protein
MCSDSDFVEENSHLPRATAITKGKPTIDTATIQNRAKEIEGRIYNRAATMVLFVSKHSLNID